MTQPTSQAADRDSQDLAAFGYRQELKRSLGRFSSFAAGFSYISILTGLFQMFYLGYGSGGPAFFWTWPLVFAGQFLVALCFAELAAHYPLSGSVYQWSKQIGHRAIAWLAGWVYLACLVITLAAVALALQVTLPQVIPGAQLIGSYENRADWAANAVLLGCFLILFSTIVNSIGVGLLAKINNVGVFSELIGVALLIVLLALHARHGPEILLDAQGKGAGRPLGYLGAFLAAALTASYVMYGFDTAGSLAEETRAPRLTAPRAILQALAAAALAGALLMLFAMLAFGDLSDPKLSREDGGLPFIVTRTLGRGLGTVFLCDVLFAITVCTLAVHTGTIRLIFAMARDNNLPFSRVLGHISATSRTPVVPALLTGLLAALILGMNAFFPGLIDLIAPMAIVWANLGYLLVVGPLLILRWQGWPACGGSGARGAFSLGRWGLPVNLVAALWSAFMVVNIAWPRPGEEPTAWYTQYGTLLFTGLLLGAGGLYYVLVQRYKTRVLEEHRA